MSIDADHFWTGVDITTKFIYTANFIFAHSKNNNNIVRPPTRIESNVFQFIPKYWVMGEWVRCPTLCGNNHSVWRKRRGKVLIFGLLKYKYTNWSTKKRNPIHDEPWFRIMIEWEYGTGISQMKGRFFRQFAGCHLFFVWRSFWVENGSHAPSARCCRSLRGSSTTCVLDY